MKHQLKWYDLVPLLNFLKLKQKCRYFNCKIPYRYYFIELLGGILALITVFLLDISFLSLQHFLIILILLAIAIIDYKTMQIPNNLLLILLLSIVIELLFLPRLPLWNHMLGAICISLPMLLLTIIIKGSFGGGDIKLMFVVGLYLSWKYIILAMIIAIFIGGVYCIYLLLGKKLHKKSHFAFGPFLVIGIMGTMLWGEYLI